MLSSMVRCRSHTRHNHVTSAQRSRPHCSLPFAGSQTMRWENKACEHSLRSLRMLGISNTSPSTVPRSTFTHPSTFLPLVLFSQLSQFYVSHLAATASCRRRPHKYSGSIPETTRRLELSGTTKAATPSLSSPLLLTQSGALLVTSGMIITSIESSGLLGHDLAQCTALEFLDLSSECPSPPNLTSNPTALVVCVAVSTHYQWAACRPQTATWEGRPSRLWLMGCLGTRCCPTSTYKVRVPILGLPLHYRASCLSNPHNDAGGCTQATILTTMARARSAPTLQVVLR